MERRVEEKEGAFELTFFLFGFFFSLKRTLLYTISKKYEQYGDVRTLVLSSLWSSSNELTRVFLSQYDQQDAHELLRHLLDSMRMEEVDVRSFSSLPSATMSNLSPVSFSSL